MAKFVSAMIINLLELIQVKVLILFFMTASYVRFLFGELNNILFLGSFNSGELFLNDVVLLVFFQHSLDLTIYGSVPGII